MQGFTRRKNSSVGGGRTHAAFFRRGPGDAINALSLPEVRRGTVAIQITDRSGGQDDFALANRGGHPVDHQVRRASYSLRNQKRGGESAGRRRRFLRLPSRGVLRRRVCAS